MYLIVQLLVRLVAFVIVSIETNRERWISVGLICQSICQSKIVLIRRVEVDSFY